MALRTKPFYPIRGVDKVLKNLNREAAKIQGATLSGLVQAGFLIQREAQKLCPVDFGNLRASAYTMWTKKKFSGEESLRYLHRVKAGPGEEFKFKSIFKGDRIEVVQRLQDEYDGVLEDAREEVETAAARNVMAVQIGFTAYYAIYVHEDASAKHKKGKQFKFLQVALFRNQGRILQIIADKARIK